MTDEQFLMKLAYPLYYTDTPEESVANLVRLIAGRLCGLDEGREYYLQRLSLLLAKPEADFPTVTLPDLPFAAQAIRRILQGLEMELKRSETT